MKGRKFGEHRRKKAKMIGSHDGPFDSFQRIDSFDSVHHKDLFTNSRTRSGDSLIAKRDVMILSVPNEIW